MHTDALGRTFQFDKPPQRVVSLVPSLTEILFDLGAGSAVVGVTDFCIFPDETKSCTRLGGTKNPKIDAIKELQPDLVYMNLEENLRRHAEAIEKFAPVFVSEPRNVADVEALVLTLASIHHAENVGDQIVSSLAEELRLLRRDARPFTFAVPIWKNPWMWCGEDTYVSNLVVEAGGVNVFAGTHRYPAMPLEEVMMKRAPEMIFLPDEPYGFTDDDAAELRQLAPTLEVVGPFAGHLFTWHGTRTILGLKMLQELVTRSR